MGLTAQNYGQLLLYSLAVGFFLGALWDFFRIVRFGLYGRKNNYRVGVLSAKSPGKNKEFKIQLPSSGREVRKALMYSHTKISPVWFLWILICDILFFVICAVTVILLLFQLSGGQLRIFAVFGSIIGFAVYYFTVGRLVMMFAELIIDTVIRFVCFLYKITLKPVIKFILSLFLRVKNSAKNRHNARLTKRYIKSVCARAAKGFE